MHYKRKGDRVDEVLHDIVLNHVNRLEQENKQLRESLKQSKYANKRIKKEARFNDYRKLQSKHYKALDENKRLQDELAKAKEFADYKLQYSNQLLKQSGELIDENKRLREALETITRRKMSCYASTEHMNRDFIKIARQALEGEQHGPSTD